METFLQPDQARARWGELPRGRGACKAFPTIVDHGQTWEPVFDWWLDWKGYELKSLDAQAVELDVRS